VVAEEAHANLHIDALPEAQSTARAELFPGMLNGLNAVVFRLVGRASAGNLTEMIDVLDQLRHLADRRREPICATLPLSGLCESLCRVTCLRALCGEP
jgi:hypothetical protein